MYFTTRTAACTERNRDKNDRLMMYVTIKTLNSFCFEHVQ